MGTHPKPTPNWPILNWPILNWKELAVLVGSIAPRVRGLFIEKVIVPERPRFASEFLKGEWYLRLSGRRAEGGLLFSVRARRPCLVWVEGRGPRASAKATHSAFDLSLSKYLKGLRIQDIEVVERERLCVFWFGQLDSRASSSQLGLVLNLIPAAPEAILVQSELESDGSRRPGWQILARSRQVELLGEYRPPGGTGAPVDPPLRPEFSSGGEEIPGTWERLIDAALETEAFAERLKSARKELSENIAQLDHQIGQAETAVEQAASEPDWQAYGDLLKAHLPEPPPPGSGNFRAVQDYVTGTVVRIPCDPRLSPQQQVSKFYQNAKRRLRREEEARNRIERFRELKTVYARAAELDVHPGDWAGLEKLEKTARQGAVTVAPKPASGSKPREFWSGRNFVSRDGLPILVGRNKAENLELTFKLARGNDLWLHVRGRPGAHVVVQLPQGKTAPLETLLDAANLAIQYSGGENWGKTEVDYTYKKYVKRIKDSTEASYTHNKTLMIEPDQVRIRRLVDSGANSGAGQ